MNSVVTTLSRGTSRCSHSETQQHEKSPRGKEEINIADRIPRERCPLAIIHSFNDLPVLIRLYRTACNNAEKCWAATEGKILKAKDPEVLRQAVRVFRTSVF